MGDGGAAQASKQGMNLAALGSVATARPIRCTGVAYRCCIFNVMLREHPYSSRSGLGPVACFRDRPHSPKNGGMRPRQVQASCTSVQSVLS